jgi:hypothetical protein
VKDKNITRGELLNFLTKEAKRYRTTALKSLKRNRHMNTLSKKDLLKLRNLHSIQEFIDAILVDFINSVGVGQGIDYALYTENLE